MKSLTKYAMLAAGAAALWSCDPEITPSDVAITINGEAVSGGVVQVETYDVDITVQSAADLTITFADAVGSETYEPQTVVGSEEPFTFTLSTKSYLTGVDVAFTEDNGAVSSFHIDGPMTSDDAAVFMDDLGANLNTDVVSMVSGEGAESIHRLADFMVSSGVTFGANGEFDPKNMVPFKRSEGEVSRPKDPSLTWVQVLQAKQASLKKVFVPSNHLETLTDTAQFNFSENWGVYEWNPTTGEFEPTTDVVSHIEFRFPSTEGGANDAIFKLTEYQEDGHVIVDGFEQWLLTSLEATLSINGTEQLSVDWEVSINSSNEATGFAAALFLNPMTYASTLAVDFTNEVITETFSIHLDDELLIGTEGSLSYQNDFTEEVEATGFVQYRDLKLAGTLDIIAMNAVTDYAATNPSEFVDAAVYRGDSKVGDIIWKYGFYFDDTYEDWYPFLLLPNGDEVDILALMESHAEQVSNLLASELADWEATLYQ